MFKKTKNLNCTPKKKTNKTSHQLTILPSESRPQLTMTHFPQQTPTSNR